MLAKERNAKKRSMFAAPVVRASPQKSPVKAAPKNTRDKKQLKAVGFAPVDASHLPQPATTATANLLASLADRRVTRSSVSPQKAPRVTPKARTKVVNAVRKRTGIIRSPVTTPLIGDPPVGHADSNIRTLIQPTVVPISTSSKSLANAPTLKDLSLPKDASSITKTPWVSIIADSYSSQSAPLPFTEENGVRTFYSRPGFKPNPPQISSAAKKRAEELANQLSQITYHFGTSDDQPDDQSSNEQEEIRAKALSKFFTCTL